MNIYNAQITDAKQPSRGERRFYNASNEVIHFIEGPSAKPKPLRSYIAAAKYLAAKYWDAKVPVLLLCCCYAFGLLCCSLECRATPVVLWCCPACSSAGLHLSVGVLSACWADRSEALSCFSSRRWTLCLRRGVAVMSPRRDAASLPKVGQQALQALTSAPHQCLMPATDSLCCRGGAKWAQAEVCGCGCRCRCP